MKLLLMVMFLASSASAQILPHKVKDKDNQDNFDYLIQTIKGVQNGSLGSISGPYILKTQAFTGDVSGTYDALLVTDDSHNHTPSTLSGIVLTGPYNLFITTVSSQLDATGIFITTATTRLDTLDGFMSTTSVHIYDLDVTTANIYDTAAFLASSQAFTGGNTFKGGVNMKDKAVTFSSGSSITIRNEGLGLFNNTTGSMVLELCPTGDIYALFGLDVATISANDIYVEYGVDASTVTARDAFYGDGQYLLNIASPSSSIAISTGVLKQQINAVARSTGTIYLALSTAAYRVKDEVITGTWTYTSSVTIRNTLEVNSVILNSNTNLGTYDIAVGSITGYGGGLTGVITSTAVIVLSTAPIFYIAQDTGTLWVSMSTSSVHLYDLDQTTIALTEAIATEISERGIADGLIGATTGQIAASTGTLWDRDYGVAYSSSLPVTSTSTLWVSMSTTSLHIYDLDTATGTLTTGKVPYTGATGSVNLGIYDIAVGSITGYGGGLTGVITSTATIVALIDALPTSGADDFGNHIATKTVTANYGIMGSSLTMWGNAIIGGSYYLGLGRCTVGSYNLIGTETTFLHDVDAGESVHVGGTEDVVHVVETVNTDTSITMVEKCKWGAEAVPLSVIKTSSLTVTGATVLSDLSVTTISGDGSALTGVIHSTTSMYGVAYSSNNYLFQYSTGNYAFVHTTEAYKFQWSTNTLSYSALAGTNSWTGINTFDKSVTIGSSLTIRSGNITSTNTITINTPLRLNQAGLTVDHNFYVGLDGSTPSCGANPCPTMWVSSLYDGNGLVADSYIYAGSTLTAVGGFTAQDYATVYGSATIQGSANIWGAISSTSSLSALTLSGGGANITAIVSTNIAAGNLHSVTSLTASSVTVTSLAAIKTPAESWIGPTNTSGIYFKGGNVGVGATVPRAKFDVTSGNANANGDAPGTVILTGPMGSNKGVYQGVLSLSANDTAAIDTGPTVVFKTRYSGTSEAAIAAIGGYKENANADDYAGYLAFNTRPMSGLNGEKMRITSAGNVGIGETNPTSQLYVSSWTSSLGYIDRTDYPETLEQAYSAVKSSQKKVNSKGLDHTKLTNFVRHEAKREIYNEVTKSTDTLTEYGRNLTATVSALNEVIKDLIKRIEALEK